MRGPDLELPAWWSSLAAGNHSAFVKWLDEAGETLAAQLDIPRPCELLGDAWSRQQALPRTDGPRDLTESGSRSEAPPPEVRLGESGIAAEPLVRGGGDFSIFSIFGAELTSILRSFDSSLFVWPQRQDKNSAWTFDKPGYLDLFAGRRGVAFLGC